MPTRSALSAEAVAALRDLPPSAKLVAITLEYEGDLTQADLAAETMLPNRTVRYALTLLEEEGIVTSRISFVDARQRVYSLTDARSEERTQSPLTPIS